MENKKNGISRRQFLSYSAMVGGAATLGAGSVLTSCAGGDKGIVYIPLKPAGEIYTPTLTDKAADGKELRAGVIGCGGRGTGAAINFLDAANGVKVVALADTFKDRVESARKTLAEKKNNEVAEANCFVGFDAYKSVIDHPEVDVLIIATPPAFRPAHFAYAVEKGKHTFLEKPVAVDAVGYRSIIASSKQAFAKGLCVITGTQRHHQRSYVASYAKIQEGLIGDITGGTVYWNQNMLWFRNREAGWSDMEWMVRDWVNWTWLSGDHIVEQHVHNIDVFNWFSGKKPVKCVAVGSRQRRITGDQFDNFSVDFEYEGGIHVHSMCRQIDGCANNVSEFIQGTKGSWNSRDMAIRDLAGNIVWQYDKETEKEFQQNDPYTLEHVNWITHIRSNKPITQAEEIAISNMTALMGREAAYTGQEITWEAATASTVSIVPETLEMGKMDMTAKIPVPGKAKEEKK